MSSRSRHFIGVALYVTKPLNTKNQPHKYMIEDTLNCLRDICCTLFAELELGPNPLPPIQDVEQRLARLKGREEHSGPSSSQNPAAAAYQVSLVTFVTASIAQIRREVHCNYVSSNLWCTIQSLNFSVECMGTSDLHSH